MRLYDCLKVIVTQHIKKGDLLYVTKKNTLRKCGPNNIPTHKAIRNIKKGAIEILHTFIEIGETR